MLHITTNNPLQSTNNKCKKKKIIIMIINYYYKQHITRQQYKSGMCIYLPNEKVSILTRFNPKKKKKLNGLNI